MRVKGKAAPLPAGVLYRQDFVSPREEQVLLSALERMAFREVLFRGQRAKRTVRLYGFEYDFDARKLLPGDPIPAELEPLRERCEELAGLAGNELVQALVSRYPPGAGIG